MARISRLTPTHKAMLEFLVAEGGVIEGPVTQVIADEFNDGDRNNTSSWVSRLDEYGLVKAKKASKKPSSHYVRMEITEFGRKAAAHFATGLTVEQSILERLKLYGPVRGETSAAKVMTPEFPCDPTAISGVLSQLREAKKIKVDTKGSNRVVVLAAALPDQELPTEPTPSIPELCIWDEEPYLTEKPDVEAAIEQEVQEPEPEEKELDEGLAELGVQEPITEGDIPAQDEMDYGKLAYALLEKVVAFASQAPVDDQKLKAASREVKQLTDALETVKRREEQAKRDLATVRNDLERMTEKHNRLRERYNDLERLAKRAQRAATEMEGRYALPESEQRKLRKLMTELPRG